MASLGKVACHPAKAIRNNVVTSSEFSACDIFAKRQYDERLVTDLCDNFGAKFVAVVFVLAAHPRWNLVLCHNFVKGFGGSGLALQSVSANDLSCDTRPRKKEATR